MAMFFFYGNRKPRKYSYKPILFDPDEEARQERLKKRISQIKRQMDNSISTEEEQKNKSDIRTEYLDQMKHLKRRKEKEEEGGKSSFLSNNGLLIIILLILLGLFFFLFLR